MKQHFLLIGANGDLATRKLYPALFSLHQMNLLNDVEAISGVSRKLSDTTKLLPSIKEYVAEAATFNDIDWNSFVELLQFHQVDATSTDSLKQFAAKHDFNDKQLIVYLSTPPKLFHDICQSLNNAGLVNEHTRLVVEKPLGTNRETFKVIHQSIKQIFNEDQVFRIDHYLGKESVQNLLALRFANIMFESIWNSQFIEHVQITISETLGVEDRHEFYEETGALRDMVQNHMLQLLCLIALEPPANLTADMIQAEKLKVLKSLRPITLQHIASKTVRGQYKNGSIDNEIIGSYINDIGATSSNTETFVAIKAEIDNWRWCGVPFYLRTGKRMNSQFAELIIQFKKPAYNIFSNQLSGMEGNQLRIRLQPDNGIKMRIMSKKVGMHESLLENLSLNLESSAASGRYNFDAYARLISEVLKGDQTLFVSAKEVIESWKWIDNIIDNWNKADMKPALYTAGTMGPNQAISLIGKDGLEWIDTINE